MNGLIIELLFIVLFGISNINSTEIKTTECVSKFLFCDDACSKLNEGDLLCKSNDITHKCSLKERKCECECKKQTNSDKYESTDFEPIGKALETKRLPRLINFESDKCEPLGCFYDVKQKKTKQIKCKPDGIQQILYFNGNNGCDDWSQFLPELMKQSQPDNPCCTNNLETPKSISPKSRSLLSVIIDNWSMNAIRTTGFDGKSLAIVISYCTITKCYWNKYSLSEMTNRTFTPGFEDNWTRLWIEVYDDKTNQLLGKSNVVNIVLSGCSSVTNRPTYQNLNIDNKGAVQFELWTWC